MKGAATLALDGRGIELDTVFLDAGGVLVNPNWDRVSGALRAHGVTAAPAALEAAEALAKRDLDTAELVPSTTDAGRGWLYFDLVLDSQLEKLEKPDPRFFALALERSGSRAERTVHVGDLYHVDVVGARGAGVEAVLLDPAGLHAGADCERVPTLLSLAERLRASP